MREVNALSFRELLHDEQANRSALEKFRFEIVSYYIFDRRGELIKTDKRLERYDPHPSMSHRELLLISDGYYATLQKIAQESRASRVVSKILATLDGPAKRLQSTVHYEGIEHMSYFEFYRALLANVSPRHWRLLSLSIMIRDYSYSLISRHDFNESLLTPGQHTSALFSKKASRMSDALTWESRELVEQAIALEIYDRGLIARNRELIEKVVKLYEADPADDFSEAKRADYDEFRESIANALDEIDVFVELQWEQGQ